MIVVKSSSSGRLYVDGYRVRIVEKLNLPPVEERLRAIREAGWSTFLLKNEEMFLDMLTDIGNWGRASVRPTERKSVNIEL